MCTNLLMSMMWVLERPVFSPAIKLEDFTGAKPAEVFRTMDAGLASDDLDPRIGGRVAAIRGAFGVMCGSDFGDLFPLSSRYLPTMAWMGDYLSNYSEGLGVEDFAIQDWHRYFHKNSPIPPESTIVKQAVDDALILFIGEGSLNGVFHESLSAYASASFFSYTNFSDL